MDVEYLKTHDNLMTVLEYYGVKLNKYGLANCPLGKHEDRKPSFGAQQGANFYNCFSCRTSGDVFSFVINMELKEGKNISFMEAVDMVCRITGEEPPKELKTIKEEARVFKESQESSLKKYQEFTMEGKIFRRECDYIYRDATGHAKFVKIKYVADDGDKIFKTKGIRYFEINGVKGVDLVNIKEEDTFIYNLMSVEDAIKHGKPIYFVEGEKDCDNLSRWDLPGTTIHTNVNSQIKWDIYREQLKGAKVIFIADNDETGIARRDNAFNNLKDVIAWAKMIDLTGIGEFGNSKDFSDWMEEGHTKDELLEVVDNTPLAVLEEYGKYKFDGLNTYYIEENKKGELIKKVLYEGKFEIVTSRTSKETGEEAILVRAKENGEETVLVLTKEELLGAKGNPFSSYKGLTVRPNAINAFKDFIYTQYTIKTRHNLINQVSTVGTLGWQYDTFIYPNKDVSFDGKHYFKTGTEVDHMFTSNGALEDSIKNVLLVLLDTKLGTIIVSTALASLLIKPLRVHESFVLDVYGENTSGKTVTLKAVASLFGSPSKYCISWDNTQPYMVTLASLLYSFPMMLDDTKKQKEKSILSYMAYSISGGRERGRCNPDGTIKDSKEFNNILISTGEVSLGDYLEGAGAFARIVPIDISRFDTFESKEQANNISYNSSKYYGTFALDYTQWLYSLVKTNIEAIEEIYQTYCDINATKETTKMSVRQGKHIALMQTAYDLLTMYLEDKGYEVSNKAELFVNLLEENNESLEVEDIYKTLHEGFCMHVTANAGKMYHENSLHDRSYVGWEKDGYIHIIDKDFLINYIGKGNDPTGILRKWKDMGILKTDKRGYKFTAKVPWKKDNKSECVYAIKRWTVGPGWNFEEIKSNQEVFPGTVENTES